MKLGSAWGILRAGLVRIMAKDRGLSYVHLCVGIVGSKEPRLGYGSSVLGFELKKALVCFFGPIESSGV